MGIIMVVVAGMMPFMMMSVMTVVGMMKLRMRMTIRMQVVMRG